MMKKNVLPFLSVMVMLGMTSCGGSGSSRSKVEQAPVRLEQAWATEAGVLKTPESVLHNRQQNILYVSNINKNNKTQRDGDGFISRLSPQGQVQDLYWVTGLNDPKGMALHNNVLYVADLSQIVTISAQTGAVLARHDVPGATFLNDVTADVNGNVYISDSDTRKIHQLRNGQVTEWLSPTREERPNGLLMETNRLLIANAGGDGTVRFIDPQTKGYTDWATGIQGGDGIVSDGRGGYLVSGWPGEVYYINAAGRTWQLLDTREQKINAADIEFMAEENLLLVPTFNDNRVVAYRMVVQ